MAEYNPPKPKLDDPKVEPKPDFDALLAAEREKTLERERESEKQQVVFNARIEQLEGVIQSKFAEKLTPVVEQPVVETPTYTSDDFLTPDGAAEAVRRAEDSAAQKAVAAVDATYRDTLMQTRAAQFDLKLESMKSLKYFKYVETKINQAIQGNPKLRYAPEALEILYNNLVGSATDEILAAEAALTKEKEDETLLEPAQRRVAPASGPVIPVELQAVTLSAAEEHVRSKFAPFIQQMRSNSKEYTAEDYARSRAERLGSRVEIPDLEEKRG